VVVLLLMHGGGHGLATAATSARSSITRKAHGRLVWPVSTWDDLQRPNRTPSIDTDPKTSQ
jgi:hypothetical protein